MSVTGRKPFLVPFLQSRNHSPIQAIHIQWWAAASGTAYTVHSDKPESGVYSPLLAPIRKVLQGSPPVPSLRKIRREPISLIDLPAVKCLSPTLNGSIHIPSAVEQPSTSENDTRPFSGKDPGVCPSGVMQVHKVYFPSSSSISTIA